jgi:hypothetical protein
MKKTFFSSLCILSSIGAFGQRLAIMTDTNGVLLSPTPARFWLANSNAINALITPSFALPRTNGINFGNAFSSVGAVENSEQFGVGATALAENAIAVGPQASASMYGSSAFGWGANATGWGSTALTGAASGDYSIAIGGESSGFSSICFGASSHAVGDRSVVIGDHSQASGSNSAAIGENLFAWHDRSVAIVFGSASSQANQIMIGSSSHSVVISGTLTVLGVDTNTLLSWFRTGNYQLLAPQRDSDRFVTNAAVLWPDHTYGVFTVLEMNPNPNKAVNSFSFTYTNLGKTIIQPPVQRNADGDVTNIQEIIIQ